MPRAFQTHVGEMSLPASGWWYCGCWEFSAFSNTFPLLLRKRFGVFLCNLSMCSKKNNSKAPTQKPLLKRPAITCTNYLANTGHSIVPVSWETGTGGTPFLPLQVFRE